MKHATNTIEKMMTDRVTDRDLDDLDIDYIKEMLRESYEAGYTKAREDYEFCQRSLDEVVQRWTKYSGNKSISIADYYQFKKATMKNEGIDGDTFDKKIKAGLLW